MHNSSLIPNMKNYFYKIDFTLFIFFFWLPSHDKYAVISKHYTRKQEKNSLGFLAFIYFLFSCLQRFTLFYEHLPKPRLEQTFSNTTSCVISDSTLFKEKLPRFIIQLYSVYYVSFIGQIHIFKDLQ